MAKLRKRGDAWQMDYFDPKGFSVFELLKFA